MPPISLPWFQGNMWMLCREDGIRSMDYISLKPFYEGVSTVLLIYARLWCLPHARMIHFQREIGSHSTRAPSVAQLQGTPRRPPSSETGRRGHTSLAKAGLGWARCAAKEALQICKMVSNKSRLYLVVLLDRNWARWRLFGIMMASIVMV